MDLRSGWNFNDPIDKQMAHEEPYLLVGGAVGDQRIGLEHLQQLLKMYEYQGKHGMLFLHAHPWESSTWQSRVLKEICKLPNTLVAHSGTKGWITNSRHI